MFSRWISVEQLALWYGLLVAAVIPLGVISTVFLRTERPTAERRKWVMLATASYFVFTVAWSLQGAMLWQPGDDLNHMLLMLVLCCTLAGNGALTGASAPISVVAYAVYGTAIVLVPLQSRQMMYWGLSGLGFFFTAYLGWMSKQYFQTTKSMLLLSNDKSDLIEALAQSKEESDLARYRAEGASRAKSQFLANMSHELRTPLNAILGFSELIQSRTINDLERHAEYAGLIHTSGTHLLTLINDILDLARIEAGGFQLKDREVDLAHVAGNCAQLMSAKAREGRVNLRTDLAADLPHIIGDERALTQVLLNLIANAVKFTPQNGQISVFALVAPDGRLCFGVEDDGVGIAPEDHALVFENFGQGRHDVVTADKGTGLGLPIVKGLVEAHDGRVELQSALGAGTKVTIYLPASRMLPSEGLRAAS
jgi:two-component system cell cycle sensor histidine kinase PleC